METTLSLVMLNRAEDARLRRRIAELQSLAEKTTTTLSKVGGGGSNETGKNEIWAQLADYKSRYEFQLLASSLNKAKLDMELDCIPAIDMRLAMKMRYVDGKKIPDIANTLGYSTRTIERYLRRGRRIYAACYEE